MVFRQILKRVVLPSMVKSRTVKHWLMHALQTFGSNKLMNRLYVMAVFKSVNNKVLNLDCCTFIHFYVIYGA